MATGKKAGKANKNAKPAPQSKQLETRNAMSTEEQQSAPAGIEIQSSETSVLDTTQVTGEASTSMDAATDSQAAVTQTPADPQSATERTLLKIELPEGTTAQEAPQVIEQTLRQVAVQSPAVAAPVAPVAATGAELELPAELTAMSRTPLLAVLDYMQQMAPKKPVDPDTAARQQVNLYRNLMWVINRLEGDQFTRAWTWLLRVFHEHRNGVFLDRYVYRFMELVPLGESDRKAFLKVLNLLKVTADPKGRKLALKQVDLVKSLQFGVTEPGRQRVQQYYQR